MDMHDFISNLTIQTDFTNEFYNNRRFRRNFKSSAALIEFPTGLMATPDILISEFITTRDIDKLPEFMQLKTCMNYACMVSQMVLVDNFIHADLHHKNWQVSLDDEQPRLIVFDTGICFSSPTTELNRQIWEAFESGCVEQIMGIMDKVIVGTYTEAIRCRIGSILDHYRDSSLDITHIIGEINSILIEYNCRLSNFMLNIIVLLCLIDTTLKKHNLIGNSIEQTTDSEPIKKHHNTLRSKNLDLIAYIRSRPGTYSNVLTYFQDKQNRMARSYSDGNISLFGNQLCYGLELDLPED
jgi:predicted unusual protein kinase regulating ubiquinone biosynthesis (AarF/ABC1/UbiB family)